MTIENDETLQIFIEESIEHLADIENDFLAIEEAGADIDEDMVNKVYRAAHSIKGGAGFMGLDNIKNLTHEIENILGKIRSREMVPNPEIVNVLLLASDAVRNLINDVFNSNEIDISEHIAALKSIIEGSLQQEAAPLVSDDALPAEKEHVCSQRAIPPPIQELVLFFPDFSLIISTFTYAPDFKACLLTTFQILQSSPRLQN